MPKRKRTGRREAIDQGFIKSLSHELRVGILEVLTERMASPKELAAELDEGLSQISYHVKVLKKYKRIELVKTEPRRGAVEHFYRATSNSLLPARTWRGIKKGLRAVVGGGLASDLFNDLADALAARKLTKADSHICRLPLVLDAEGWLNVMARAERFTEGVEEEQRASVARRAKANGDADDLKGYTIGVLAFADIRDVSADKARHPKATRSGAAGGKGAKAKGKSNNGRSGKRKTRGAR